ncbi:hypothetical protein H696_02217 [Fonticula alba]|uniref:HTH cro/C1-type domain-containing protein n=1 Tax=Fonticula alba TaxID=691883 RepID=A0A058ZAE2_FONAL|nr:hypothetical protein H696_02217 [Fonticula alba]KCV71270.1 hypothetical protein H696_02217 [Fonticula alba]|eukprot:XP_009494393.1 hypothetical protein H696_02217 [Fonticula alba]
MDEWDTVTYIRRPGGSTASRNTGQLRTEADLNRARRLNANIQTERRPHAPGNRRTTDLNAARLDRETEELQHRRVSVEVSRTIARARTEKGLTQKEFASKIFELPSVVSEYENGRAIPNQQVLSKMERVLGVKLRGKGIGEPIQARVPKK